MNPSELPALQKKYEELYGTPPNNKFKNNADYLRNKIDEALEKGVKTSDEDGAPAEAGTPGAVTKDENGAPVGPDQAPADGETPSDDGEKYPKPVQDTIDELEGKRLIGKFYTGDGEGGNWEILINENGTSVKKLS